MSDAATMLDWTLLCTDMVQIYNPGLQGAKKPHYWPRRQHHSLQNCRRSAVLEFQLLIKLLVQVFNILSEENPSRSQTSSGPFPQISMCNSGVQSDKKISRAALLNCVSSVFNGLSVSAELVRPHRGAVISFTFCWFPSQGHARVSYFSTDLTGILHLRYSHLRRDAEFTLCWLCEKKRSSDSVMLLSDFFFCNYLHVLKYRQTCAYHQTFFCPSEFYVSPWIVCGL